MLQRLRLVCETKSDKFGSTRGPIEVDECFAGGKPKNMHLKKRMELNDHRLKGGGLSCD